MKYLPSDLWNKIINNTDFKSYLNMRILDKDSRNLFKLVDYKRSDFLDYVFINKDIIKDVEIIILILKKIKSYSCDNIVKILNNILKKKFIN